MRVAFAAERGKVGIRENVHNDVNASNTCTAFHTRLTHTETNPHTLSEVFRQLSSEHGINKLESEGVSRVFRVLLGSVGGVGGQEEIAWKTVPLLADAYVHYHSEMDRGVVS